MITGVWISLATCAVDAKPSRADLAIEEAHNAFDDRDIGGFRSPCPMQQQRRYLLLPAEVGIEVASQPAGGQRVVARVDVVRPDFEACDFQTCGSQRTHESGGNGCLAVTRTGSGDHQTGKLSGWPLVISGRSPLDSSLTLLSIVEGVFDLGHLGDQLGCGDSLASARRPVMITCW